MGLPAHSRLLPARRGCEMDGIVKRVAVAVLLLAFVGVAGCGGEVPEHPAIVVEEPVVEVPLATGDERGPDGWSAVGVLDSMATAYAGCESYADSGLVKTVFTSARGKRTVERPFRTAFVRPDRFRYEYSSGGDPEQRYTVWRKGKEVRTWWFVDPGVERSQSLNLALAGATGVSDGSAHTIPALLLPREVSGRRLLDMTDVRRLDDERLAGVDCFRIAGLYADDPMTLWIDRKSFLVRQILKHDQFSDFSTVATTTYDPVVNTTIPDGDLAFDPPEKK